jgi:diguanylate cyclase (GGDEF)-like protein
MINGKNQEDTSKGNKILIVDDTPENIDVLRQTLAPEGYKISVAPSGEKALNIAQRVIPDLILLDIMMPGIDGFETCARIKKDPLLKDIPVIFISAKSETEDIVEGFNHGGVDYISKPFRQEEVFARVNTHLKIKNQIIDVTKTAASKNQSLKKELEVSRETANKLSKKLEETESKSKSLVDPLTKVLNRAAYNMKVGQVVRDLQNHQGSTALIVADIDYFKKFNDDYGHKTGDRVLQSVASTIQDSIRSTDLVFRYGGEKFVILLYKNSLEQAEKDAEKIRNQVKKDFFVDKNKELKVTLSLGVTCAKDGDTKEMFFERADKALYLAKRKGRDRVCISSNESGTGLEFS